MKKFVYRICADEDHTLIRDGFLVKYNMLDDLFEVYYVHTKETVKEFIVLKKKLPFKIPGRRSIDYHGNNQILSYEDLANRIKKEILNIGMKDSKEICLGNSVERFFEKFEKKHIEEVIERKSLRETS